MIRRAVRMGAANIRMVDLRDFSQDARKTADDRPYGGGPGMLMKPEPLFEAVEALKTPQTRVVLMAPSGKRFEQADARRLARATSIRAGSLASWTCTSCTPGAARTCSTACRTARLS